MAKNETSVEHGPYAGGIPSMTVTKQRDNEFSAVNRPTRIKEADVKGGVSKRTSSKVIGKEDKRIDGIATQGFTVGRTIHGD